MNKYENVMVNVMIKMHFSLPIREAGVVRPYPAEWDLVHTLPSSKLRPSKHLTAKGHQTNISTTLSLRQGTW